MILAAEVAGLDEIHDAPQVEQAVFERRAGQSEALIGAELFDRLSDLGGGIFDELGLVENDGAELEFLEGLEVAPEQGVIGDDEVVLRNLFPEIVPRSPALENEHLKVRREPVCLPEPIVQHGGRANDEGRPRFFGVLAVQPGEPGEGLEGFTQAHVVGQNSPEFQPGEMAEEIEPGPLIGTHLGPDGVRECGGLDAVEFRDPLAEHSGLLVAETLQGGVVELGGMEHGDLLLRDGQSVHAEVGHCFVRGLDGGGVELNPAAVGQFHKAARGGLEALQIRRGELHAFHLPFGGDRQPVDTGALNDEPGA